MEETRIDRRVQRTRMLLHAALRELMTSKGYDAISIQEITDKANLGRATFYLHYRSKNELLLECMQEMVDLFIDRIQQIPVESWALSDGAPLQQVFEYAQENADLYKIVINSQGAMSVSRQLHNLIANNTFRVLKSQLIEKGLTPRMNLNFICSVFAGSLLSLVYWWFENGMPYPPAEMASMFHDISLYGRAYAMGIEESI